MARAQQPPNSRRLLLSPRPPGGNTEQSPSQPHTSRRVTSLFRPAKIRRPLKPRQAPVIPGSAAPRRHNANAITAQTLLKYRPGNRPLNPPSNTPTAKPPANLASPPEGTTPPTAGYPHRRPVLPSQTQQPPQKPPQLTAAFPFPDNARSTRPAITPRRQPTETEAPPAHRYPQTLSPQTLRAQQPSPTAKRIIAAPLKQKQRSNDAQTTIKQIFQETRTPPNP